MDEERVARAGKRICPPASVLCATTGSLHGVVCGEGVGTLTSKRREREGACASMFAEREALELE